MEYKSQNVVCQNCKGNFIIEPDDFGFYEKIKVPPPTFCPDCRYIRRLLDRNEYNFYKRKCDATGKDIISIYRPDAPFSVYEQEYWKSDAFDAKDYGRDFDFSRSFFEQYEELRREVPHLAMVNSNSVNSEYTNQSQDNKECYMLVTSGSNEKCMYGSWCHDSHFLSDCYMAFKSEFCYECMNIARCSKCVWCQDCFDSVGLEFCIDCRGCLNCFGCVGLRKRQYYWFNKALTKTQYEEKLKKFSFNRSSIEESKKKVMELNISTPVKYYHGSKIQNSTGDYIGSTQRARRVFNCHLLKDTAYMQDVWFKTADCQDCTEVIIGELSYEVQGVESPHRSMFIRSCFNSITDSCYCDMCFTTDNCFGCFGLKKGQYCILNKQYTKEQYTKLKSEIIEHMRKTKEWGEYFPARVSPFAYNESMAQDYFPLTKNEVLKKGYTWYDRPPRDYQITLLTKNLPKTFSDIKENLAKETIQCSSQNSSSEKEKYPLCITAFKIIPLELSLCKILNLPIPEKCFSCRRQDRFVLRNPRKLWHRKCMKKGCLNKFETSYAPNRPEIIYCEKCYQAEVY
ncbi:MAG: hypothetical protein UW01_C0001G0045 [Candidatus Nomurabacteria bacterium GW2011_GWA2_43_66]|nr:MAG: hypothetical protein UV13_C0001G0044 [Parcubacteria group bacterium GW2011_GWC1_42_21]KKT00736.1 MAG: hypothetical protein UV77_C0001G0107 [Candidatus Nomurabacteria bacterium GW2011_GWA1_43_17]KKT07934.1 MAG: hypothetical protein UV85_C0003G0059 [Candidatus Nomurabacteria bacterium GW2011_GWB1_43_19]KKT11895.1 MAG: hypothetical protein UV91_C0001G0107 [Candidatus Nomurabacteria bacterium GW2011_GWF2_43_24]KKT18351.1 MAG: hypothetical protein UW01_C0001G0045 [Candidatus Nomurabacteria b